MTAARPVQKIDDPPAPAPEPAPPRKPPAPVRIEGAWARKRAELAAAETGGGGDGETGPPAPPAQGPPQDAPGGPPASAAAPIPAAALPPSTAAFDAAWARLMSRPRPSPKPPAARTPAATRPGVGASALELARAVAGGGDVGPLVDHLAARWKDRKPETLSFWRSALAELSTGLVTPELVAGLVADADRRGVGLRSHQFSRALGSELSAARKKTGRRVSRTPTAGLKAHRPRDTHRILEPRFTP